MKKAAIIFLGLLLLCAMPAAADVQMRALLDSRMDPEDSPTFTDLILSGGNIFSASSINLKPSDDNDDYLSFSTVNNIPYINIIGGEYFIVSSDSSRSGVRYAEDTTHYLTAFWSDATDTGVLGSTHKILITSGNNEDITLTPDGTGEVNVNSNLNVTGATSDGTATLSGGSLTSVKLGSLTDNGFVITESGDGSLSVDTNTYLNLDQTTPQTIANGIPLMITEVDGEGPGSQLVNMDFVDLAVSSLELSEFFHDDADALGGLYWIMDETEDTAGTVVSAGVPTGAAVNIFNFLTPDGKPALDRLLRGRYRCHAHLLRSASITRDVSVYYELWKRESIGLGGDETLLDTSETIAITTDPTQYEIHLVLADELSILVTDRILIKWYAIVTGAGGVNPTITMSTGATNNSHFSVNVNSLGLSTIYVPQSLATAANDFIVASGLGVFAKKSLTETGSLLEGDMEHDNLQGGHQDVKTTASPTWENATLTSATPILVFKDNNSLGAASVGYIEWRDSGGGRAGFLGNNTAFDDGFLWKNEQGGNIGIQTTGAGEFQIFANTVLNGNLLGANITATTQLESDLWKALNSGDVDVEWTGSQDGYMPLDGDNDFLTLTDTGAFDFTGPFSIAFWVYNDDNALSEQITRTTNASTTNYTFLHLSDKYRFYVGGFAAGDFATTTGTKPTATWIHLVGVWDGVNTKLYCDGVDQTDATLPSAPVSLDVATRVGIRGFEDTRDFNGRMSDIMFFGAALDQTAITALYNLGDTSASTHNPQAYSHADLIEWFKLTQNFDGAITGHTGTPSGDTAITVTDTRDLEVSNSLAVTDGIGVWGVAVPLSQPSELTLSASGITTGGGGTTVTDTDTFDGGLGGSEYTIGDIVEALKLQGILAE